MSRISEELNWFALPPFIVAGQAVVVLRWAHNPIPNPVCGFDSHPSNQTSIARFDSRVVGERKDAQRCGGGRRETSAAAEA